MASITEIRDGAGLKKAREALGLNQVEFGRALGIEGKYVSRQYGRYERGERDAPRAMRLLAECLLQGARPSSWPKDDA